MAGDLVLSHRQKAGVPIQQVAGIFQESILDSVFATDLTPVEVWMRSGLTTFYILAVMHLKTRRVDIAGITPSPHAQ